MSKVSLVTIKELKPGERCLLKALVRQAQEGKSARGPYLRLLLQDATGEVQAYLWDRKEEDASALRPGTVVGLQGAVERLGERTVLVIERYKLLPDASPAEFLRRSPHDGEQMFQELCQLAGSIAHEQLRSLVLSFLEDPEVQRKIRIWAASPRHHSYAEGYLEHTLRVAKAVDRLVPLYPEADRDLALAGAILCGIGKLWAFGGPPDNEYTTTGELVGYVVLGAIQVHQAAQRAALPQELADKLLHIVVSHRGRGQWGSPVRPSTPEAILVHMLGMLDAMMHMEMSEQLDS